MPLNHCADNHSSRYITSRGFEPMLQQCSASPPRTGMARPTKANPTAERCYSSLFSSTLIHCRPDITSCRMSLIPHVKGKSTRITYTTYLRDPSICRSEEPRIRVWRLSYSHDTAHLSSFVESLPIAMLWGLALFVLSELTTGVL